MASSAMSIRPALPSDWAVIAAIHAASWRSAYRGIYPDSYLEEEAPAERRAFWCEAFGGMDRDFDAVFLAEQAREPVGFACVRRKAEAAGPLLDNLHVLPGRKGEGIGRRLIAAAASWLVEKEPEAALQLVVWADNVPARRFYESLGGCEAEVFDAPIPGGGTAPQVRVRWERAADLAC
jgi:ribosomal protein S18 acetylase RimI-like enzyme